MQAPGARNVLVKASAAYWLDATALPPLNPNHPNQSRAAPNSTNGTFPGRNAWRP